MRSRILISDPLSSPPPLLSDPGLSPPNLGLTLALTGRNPRDDMSKLSSELSEDWPHPREHTERKDKQSMSVDMFRGYVLYIYEL